MPRTFIDQSTQVFRSTTFNDSFAVGVQLVSSSNDLQDDLNALRTQIRQVLWASSAGNWYDGVQGVANVTAARGLNALNSALSNVEQQRFIYTIQSTSQVAVPSGSNFVSLSVSGTTAPSGKAAVGLAASPGVFTGSIVATLSGSPTGNGQPGSAHSMNMVSGSSPFSPRNLVTIRDAFTHETFLDTVHSNHQIFGLLQIESGALDSQNFSDVSPGRTQISFVVEYPSGSWLPADVGSIGGKIVNYQYRARTSYVGLPDDAYVNTVFLDITPIGTSGNYALQSDITLQKAITNQGNTAVLQSGFNTLINLAGGGLGSWSYLSASQTLLASVASTNTVVVGSNVFSVSSSNPAAFTKGIQVATGSNEIDIGVVAGTIATKLGQNLIISGGSQLNFSDQYGPTSTFTSGVVSLATSSAEWNSYFTAFGASSLLGSITSVSSSLSSSVVQRRVKVTTGVFPTTIAADTNINFPTNVDSPLLSYLGRDFVKDVNVYLNGVLCISGRSSADGNDVYPGTSLSSGDLKFGFSLRSGSTITVERFL